MSNEKKARRVILNYASPHPLHLINQTFSLI